MIKKIFTVCIFASVSFFLKAQDKYNYATVSFLPASNRIVISSSVDDFKKIEIAKGEMKDNSFDFTPVLKELKAMNDEGWEVYNTGSVGQFIATVFYLRKKITK